MKYLSHLRNTHNTYINTTIQTAIYFTGVKRIYEKLVGHLLVKVQKRVRVIRLRNSIFSFWSVHSSILTDSGDKRFEFSTEYHYYEEE